MERRRRRPAVSCTLCRKRKIRCNREQPCSNCLVAKGATCTYDQYPPLLSRQRQVEGQNVATSAAIQRQQLTPISIASASTIGHTPDLFETPSEPRPGARQAATVPISVSQSSTRDFELESLKQKVKELEKQLARATKDSHESPKSQCNNDTAMYMDRTFHFRVESRLFGGGEVFNRSIMHKTRLFGQSHWMNVAVMFRDMLDSIELYVRDAQSSASSSLQRYKSLARIVKAQRAPPWPTPLTPDLPPRDVTDKLVDCYLKSTESLYRILHIPSFKKEYEALWVSGASKPDSIFLVQLKLVLAIGATTYDEGFSFRTQAVRWIYEAETWWAEPEFKARLSLQNLQVEILLLFARETANLGAALVWVTAGALLRKAVYMGLHRDPSCLPVRTLLAAEMRRRLWNTILELSIESSMNAGGPPLISLQDFDTAPPGNFNDEDLTAENPSPASAKTFTQTTVAIALRKTFPIRLAINKFLNDLDPQTTYEETLSLDKELRASCREVYQCLQGFKKNSSGPSSPSTFETRAIDFIMRRFFSALHLPFYGPALQEAAYAYSRKVVIENLLRAWYLVCPPSAALLAGNLSEAVSSEYDLLERMSVCGFRSYRTVSSQAGFAIGAELKAQIREDQSLGPTPLRQDLCAALKDIQAWCLRCIKAGETNIKGYMVVCMISAMIEGLQRGYSKEELAKHMIRAAEESGNNCLPILEESARKGQAKEPLDSLASSIETPAYMEDWDLMMSETQFIFGDAEPMNWAMNGEMAQDPTLW